MTKLIFQKALIQIRQVYQKNVVFAIIGYLPVFAYFLDKNFNYDPYLCNGCHDLMQKALKKVAIVSIIGNDYRIHFSYISKYDAITLMTNSNLNDKNVVLNFFFHHIENMIETTYYQRNREVILNRAKDYYENDKELLRERESKKSI